MKFTHKIYILLLLLIPCLSAPAANAAEPVNYYKLTCIPELNYMELTSVFSEQTLSEDIRKKYFIYPRDVECLISGKRITLGFEEMIPDAKYVSGKENSRIRNSLSSEPNSRVTIYRDGEPVATVENFGSYSYKVNNDDVEKFPHILVVDGSFVKTCTGAGIRECQLIKTKQ
jgi:hypothetical protein